MQLTKIFLLATILLPCFLFSQEKETVYLLFDSNSKEACKIELEETYENPKGVGFIKKYRLGTQNDAIIFNICEESFVLDKKDKIDTCSVKYLTKIKFETLQTINNKRKSLKGHHFFKNSVFKKIYLIEKYKNKIIKYPVIWNTDLIE